MQKEARRNGQERILIGFAEALSAPEVAWDLIEDGYHVIAFTRAGNHPPLRRCKDIKILQVENPSRDAWKTVEDIKRIVETEGVAAVMPLDDRAVWLCDKLSTDVNIPIVGPTGESAALALDKCKQIECARQAGFRIPETRRISDPEEVLAAEYYPYILKPAYAVLEKAGKLVSGKIQFVCDEEDRDAWLKTANMVGPMVMQPVIKGIGEGLFGIASKKAVGAWSGHRRIRMMNPNGSGSSACMSVDIEDQPVRAASQMMKMAGWQGIFMIELLRDHSKNLWFMELNGRAWGSMALALKLGHRYPSWAVRSRLDSDYDIPRNKEFKQITCRHLGREIVHLMMIVWGSRLKCFDQPSKWKSVYDVLKMSREDKWYNWKSDCPLLFIEDTIRTIAGVIGKRLA